MDVVIPEDDPYRILAENLPWVEIGDTFNRHRSLKLDIENGRPLNLRLHTEA